MGRGHYIESTRGASLADVGFIHCSFAHQVETVAKAVYGDWPGELLLLEIDPARLSVPVRVEKVEGGTEGFPHVFGALPCAAVTRVRSLERSGGRWRMPHDR